MTASLSDWDDTEPVDQVDEDLDVVVERYDLDDEDDDASVLYYGSVDEFVREFLFPLYRRRIDGDRANGSTSFRWDPQWWNHPEAVARLEALWRAWEHLRQDPSLGLSVWFRDHADHHMPILLSQFGPFRSSDHKATPDGGPLPYDAPPAGLYPDLRAH